MGLFGKSSFLGSCFRGWGSSNVGVQTAGFMVGTCLIGFYLLWKIGAFVVDKIAAKKEKATDNQV